MKTKIKKHTLFTAASLVVILASIFIVCSLLSQLSQTSDDYLDEKQSLSEELLHAKNLEGVDHKRVTRKTEELKDLFSNPNRPINNILFLERTLENNNLEGDVATGQKITDSDPWPYLEFNIRTEGRFVDVLSFITEVRSGEKLLTVEDLSVEAEDVDEGEDGEESERDLVANFIVKAYFLD